MSKRKAFNSKKTRIINSEHEMILRYAELEERTNPKLKNIKLKKKENWKKQSEILRNVAKVNKNSANFSKKYSLIEYQSIEKNMKNGFSIFDNQGVINSIGKKYNDDVYLRLNQYEKNIKDIKVNNNYNLSINKKNNTAKSYRININS